MKETFYIYNFSEHIEELREDDTKREMVAKFEKAYGPIGDQDITDLDFYQQYLSRFKLPDTPLRVPEDMEDDFDFDLLLRLVVGSFSSKYKLVYNKEQKDMRLLITVRRDNESSEKWLDELWSFQILRLFEIYVEEQINLATLMKENDSEEEEGIVSYRNNNIDKFQHRIDEIASTNEEMESLYVRLRALRDK